MKLDMSGTLCVLSAALDYVESEVFSDVTHHSRRVAYLCLTLGRSLDYPDSCLSDLTGVAVMHDNALTEYIAAKRMLSRGKQVTAIELTPHCELGEKNMERLPFYSRVKGVILYHHENADGSGPFHRKTAETPVFSRMIHLADQLDTLFHLAEMTPKKYEQLVRWVKEERGALIDGELAEEFLKSVSFEMLKKMEGERVTALLSSSLPIFEQDYGNEEIIALATVFARIIDYKSHFTSTHSLGIAQKAAAMGKFRDCSEEECTKLYLAGALHDIGKLTIPNEILEKPGKLTKAEFEIMKGHAYASYQILKKLKDLPDVTSWAYLHHEKLDGSGYPFGKTAAELNENERLLACLDIYQALTEARPYKAGLSHSRAIRMMRDLASTGKIDAGITEEIDKCFSVGGAANRMTLSVTKSR